jgi:hypothetical protein
VEWLERAKETHKYHSRKKKENKKWRLQDTAKELNRSLGSICEDILISKWYKTHPHLIEKCSYAKDALEVIREKEADLAVDDVEE